MQRKDGEKPQYAFLAGLVTEQSPVNVVEGSVLEISNFEINRNGSLRRRKAIDVESGGTSFTLNTSLVGDEAFQSYIWRAAGGDPSRVVIVTQIGESLYFWNDDETISTHYIGSVSLSAYITPTASPTQLRTSVVCMADGRGSLFVTGRYTEPLYINLSGSMLSAHNIKLSIRDFTGVEDGTPWTYKPSVLTDAHKYNLANRGWNQDDYEQFLSDIGVLPGKNMIPYAGLARQVDPAVQESFGTNQWNSAKLAAEFFGDSSAPMGRLFLDPFDTTASQSTGGDPGIGTVGITTWTSSGAAGPQTVTVTTAGVHGRTTGQSVVISGNSFSQQVAAGHGGGPTINLSFDGNHTITVISPTVFTFPYSFPNNFIAWVNQYQSLGIVIGTGTTSPTLVRDGGYSTFERPQVCAYWAGRVWYGGVAYTQLADILMFTQIVERPSQFGNCYQANDPTGQNFNNLLPNDGGTIKVPGLNGVLDMKVLGGSLIIYTTSGIWEVTGGANGFDALTYRVRKVSDAECVSRTGTCKVDAAHVAATKRGLYAIGVDTNSGYVSAQNISSQKINTFWNNITDNVKSRIMCDYDDAQKRVYVSYGGNSAVKLQNSLVLGMDVGQGGAFYTITLPYRATGTGQGYTLGQFVLESGDNANVSKKMKWVVVDGADPDVIHIADMAQSGYQDITLNQTPPYATFAHDNTGDWTKRRYVSQYVFCFMAKTETGYVAVDDELMPVNPSSLLLQGRWDWADHANSGKYSAQQQIYRHRREYVPTSESDGFDDGSPVVITRNKLRGSGRALQLRIDGQDDKDAHLLGWAIEYGTARN